jgi:phospholipase D1/2
LIRGTAIIDLMRRPEWAVRTAGVLGVLAVTLVLLYLALATPLQPRDLALWVAPWRSAWYGLPLVMLGFVALGILPVTLLVAATGLAFGPLLGPVYAMAGCLSSATAAFAAGRWLGRRRLAAWRHPRIVGLTRAAGRNGLLTVFLIRKVPAPFALVNLAIGASAISYRDFIIGTALGMAAMVLALAGFSSQLLEAWRTPSIASVTRAGLLLVVPLTVAWTLNRWLRSRAHDDVGA